MQVEDETSGQAGACSDRVGSGRGSVLSIWTTITCIITGVGFIATLIERNFVLLRFASFQISEE